MDFIELERRTLDLDQYANRAPQESDCAETIDGDTTLVENGAPLIVYKTLDRANFDPDAIAAGLQRIEYDQTVRVKKLVTQSRTFGYQPRSTIRRDYCTAAKLAYEHPNLNALLCDYARRAVAEYQLSAPDLLAQHESVVRSRVRDDMIIPGTPFTSGIVNKNNPLMYHFDGGNDHDVWSAMFCFRKKTDGGRLAVPEFGVKFAIADNSLLMFDGQKLLHGVTPILARGRGAYRFTVVYYSRREMWNCLPLDAEVARIRTARTDRERKRAFGTNRAELEAQLDKLHTWSKKP